MKKMSVLVLSLIVSAGCVESEEGTVPDDELPSVAALGGVAGCTLLRPFGWSVNGVSCMESTSLSTPVPMAAGETYVATSVPWGPIGVGFAVVQCAGDGELRVLRKVCRPSVGEPF